MIDLSKIIVLSFSDGEEDIYQSMLQAMSNHKGFEWCNAIQKPENIRLGEVTIDLFERIVSIKGIRIALTNREFDILYLLAKSPGRVFSKEQIYDAVWNNEYVFDERNMTAYINKIRRKIEPDPAHPRYIITVWGVGYKFSERTK